MLVSNVVSKMVTCVKGISIQRTGTCYCTNECCRQCYLNKCVSSEACSGCGVGIGNVNGVCFLRLKTSAPSSQRAVNFAKEEACQFGLFIEPLNFVKIGFTGNEIHVQIDSHGITGAKHGMYEDVFGMFHLHDGVKEFKRVFLRCFFFGIGFADREEERTT